MQNEQQNVENVQGAGAVAGILMLAPDSVPPQLDAWLHENAAPALVVSIERLQDGRLALQALPELDPTIVAQIRRVLAQHADVLRRLT